MKLLKNAPIFKGRSETTGFCAVGAGKLVVTDNVTWTEVHSPDFDFVGVHTVEFKQLLTSLSNLQVHNDKLCNGQLTLNHSEHRIYDFQEATDGQERFEKCFSIGAKELVHLLEESDKYMAKNDVRYYLNGFNVRVSNNKINVTCSTGSKLSLIECNLANVSKEVDFTLERDVAKLLSSLEGYIDVAESENYVMFRFFTEGYKIHIFTRKVDSKYPDFSKVFDQSFNTVLIDNQKLAIKNLKDISNFVGKEDGVRLQINKERTIVLTADEAYLCELPIHRIKNCPDTPIEFCVKYSYLVELLSRKGEIEYLEISIDGTCIKATHTGNKTTVVMGMRL